jgi:hypothetical protein
MVITRTKRGVRSGESYGRMAWCSKEQFGFDTQCKDSISVVRTKEEKLWSVCVCVIKKYTTVCVRKREEEKSMYYFQSMFGIVEQNYI